MCVCSYILKCLLIIASIVSGMHSKYYVYVLSFYDIYIVCGSFMLKVFIPTYVHMMSEMTYVCMYVCTYYINFAQEYVYVYQEFKYILFTYNHHAAPTYICT